MRKVLIIASALAALVGQPEVAFGANQKVLFSFNRPANHSDGVEPQGGVVVAPDGQVFGTTLRGGGRADTGSIFGLDPSGAKLWQYSFGPHPTNGSTPVGQLIIASDGNLYGVSHEGPLGGGAVYKISQAGQQYAIVYGFEDAFEDSPSFPASGVIEANDGALYGTTQHGGNGLQGTVFRLTLDGTMSVLHPFASDGSEGWLPQSSLLQANDGRLYGVASGGGAAGHGTLFSVGLDGTFSVLHSFSSDEASASAGHSPLAQLPDGALFGVTPDIAFKLDATGRFTVLHRFGSQANNGLMPYSGLTLARDGYLYGTTLEGGAKLAKFGQYSGTVYRISESGKFTVVHSFGEGPGFDIGYNPASERLGKVLYGRLPDRK